mmetsp:Transcript_89786/g.238536  ORF Transcript_89786/g.238536 Transcript_89786/m.238536 type:complete len:334 (-) Transcript_89786:103-1104(-)
MERPLKGRAVPEHPVQVGVDEDGPGGEADLLEDPGHDNDQVHVAGRQRAVRGHLLEESLRLRGRRGQAPEAGAGAEARPEGRERRPQEPEEVVQDDLAEDRYERDAPDDHENDPPRLFLEPDCSDNLRMPGHTHAGRVLWTVAVSGKLRRPPMRHLLHPPEVAAQGRKGNCVQHQPNYEPHVEYDVERVALPILSSCDPAQPVHKDADDEVRCEAHLVAEEAAARHGEAHPADEVEVLQHPVLREQRVPQAEVAVAVVDGNARHAADARDVQEGRVFGTAGQEQVLIRHDVDQPLGGCQERLRLQVLAVLRFLLRHARHLGRAAPRGCKATAR